LSSCNYYLLPFFFFFFSLFFVTNFALETREQYNPQGRKKIDGGAKPLQVAGGGEEGKKVRMQPE
jgi:hypothetical protein